MRNGPGCSKFLSALALVLFALFGSATRAQEAAAVRDLVVVDSEPGEPYNTVREAMLKALAESGYREGVNLKIHYASLGNFEGRADRLWEILGYKNYRYFFINGTIAARAFQKLAWNDGRHRFVFCAVTDPVGMGLIDDFGVAPKANFTGVSYPVPVRERLRFVQRILPKARKIGFIYADMPQGQSYRRWLEDVLQRDPEFRGIEVVFRKVQFVRGENGNLRMSLLAREYVKELDSQVDVFLAPNDQMGAHRSFSEGVYQTATKPLIGIVTNDVLEKWGATATISPALDVLGRQSAAMVRQMLDDKPIASIPSEPPRAFSIAIDAAKARRFAIDTAAPAVKDSGATIVGE